MKTELQQAIQDLESQLAELKAKLAEIEQEEWWEAPDEKALHIMNTQKWYERFLK